MKTILNLFVLCLFILQLWLLVVGDGKWLLMMFIGVNSHFLDDSRSGS